MDLGRFYALTKKITDYEKLVKDAKKELDAAFDELVPECPHSESVDHRGNYRGAGITRICKICGIEDHASEGGTPGDEYDYGYPGSPNRAFWKGSTVETTTDSKYFYSFRRGHRWRVSNGKATDK